MKNKLFNSVKEVEARRLAYQKPAETLQGIVSDLHASVATVRTTDLSDPVALYTGRHYHRRNQGKKGKFCLDCKKQGCWSTNHSTSERLAALKKHKKIRQFLAEIGEEDENNDEDENSDGSANELVDELENIVTHMINIIEDQDDSREPTVTMADVRDDDEISAFAAQLREVATAHALTRKVYDSTRYRREHFYGVMVDTGAARGSTCSETQYLAYCRQVGKAPSINASRKANCVFGIGSTPSKGIAEIEFPVGNIILTFSVHIVEADVLLPLCLDGMVKMGLFYNNFADKLEHPASGQPENIIRQFDHPYVLRNAIINCFCSENELKRLHRRFGHPSPETLHSLFRRTDLSQVDSKNRSFLKEKVRHCRFCQRYAQKPRRFKFTLRTDKHFTHIIYVDIFYIERMPVFHVVDESTNYQAAKWLRKLTRKICDAQSVFAGSTCIWVPQMYSLTMPARTL